MMTAGGVVTTWRREQMAERTKTYKVISQVLAPQPLLVRKLTTRGRILTRIRSVISFSPQRAEALWQWFGRNPSLQ